MKKLIGLARRCCSRVPRSRRPRRRPASRKQNVTNLTFATYVWQPTTVKAMNSIVDSLEQEPPADPGVDRPGRRQLRARQAADELRRRHRGRHHPRRGRGHPRLHPAGLPREPDAADPEGPEGVDPEVGLGHVNFGGKITGVPIMLQTYNVFANMDLLKAAGIKAPTVTAPWTWDQFRADREAADARTATSASAGASARRPRLIQTLSLNWGGQWNYLEKGNWMLNFGPAEKTTADDDARHDLRRQVGRPGRRRPLRLAPCCRRSSAASAR